MTTVAQVASAIENAAPPALQEAYDNAGLQVGNPAMQVQGVMLCLDVTQEVLNEAGRRGCNLVVSHHPLLFKSLKQVVYGQLPADIVIRAVADGIAIYAAHTNLDKAEEGINHELARCMGLKNISVLTPEPAACTLGLGMIGDITPTPALEFLRGIKHTFGVRCLRYSQTFPKLTVKRVAVCGGAGASLISDAVAQGADAFVTGDLKYHDFTTWAGRIMLADIGHWESEVCAKNIFARIIKSNFPDLPVFMSDTEIPPINIM